MSSLGLRPQAICPDLSLPALEKALQAGGWGLRTDPRDFPWADPQLADAFSSASNLLGVSPGQEAGQPAGAPAPSPSDIINSLIEFRQSIPQFPSVPTGQWVQQGGTAPCQGSETWNFVTCTSASGGIPGQVTGLNFMGVKLAGG